MPNYDYECKECTHRENVFQKMSDAKRLTCPKCLKESFQRKIGSDATPLHFKGSGYYITDCENLNCQESGACGRCE